jgi:hypothetical protein
LINAQLRKDKETYDLIGGTKTLSLVSKWVPRESSKFGWMYEMLACNYYPEYMSSVNEKPTSKERAIKKCKAQYRVLCATLNRHLDTVQIKQAGNAWATIDHSKTTSITMTKQRNAFLNQKGVKKEQRSEDPDRILCAENLRAYLTSLKKEGKEVKGKNVGLEMFTQQAMSIINFYHASGNLQIADQEAADILDSQWCDNCNKKNANGLGNMIAMVDLSGSMNGDPMNAAIALGCRVAEKSILGKRVMTFSEKPSWINLDGSATFTKMVQEILNNSRCAGMNTDFYAALDMILGAIEQNRVSLADASNMILAIFSDMQIDDNLSQMNGTGYNCNKDQKMAARRKWATMFEEIKTKYAEVGMRMYGEPLTPPHILFWNLRQTEGFPTLSTEAGCSMMSGYDPTILNMFCEFGMEALKEMTPYKTLIKLLDNERYAPLETAIQQSNL